MDSEDPTKSRDPQNWEVPLISPEAETPRVKGPLLKFLREEPPGFGRRTTNTPRSEKVKKWDPAKTCRPGTGTPPKGRPGPAPLIPADAVTLMT